MDEMKMNRNSWGRAATPGPQGPSTSSKSGGRAPGAHEGLGAAMAAELMIGFWFGIGVVLAVKTV